MQKESFIITCKESVWHVNVQKIFGCKAQKLPF